MTNSTYLVEVMGDHGHGSRSKSVKNQAILIAMDLIADLQSKFTSHDSVSLKISAISAGENTSFNQFPTKCSFRFNLTSASKSEVVKAEAKVNKIIANYPLAKLINS